MSDKKRCITFDDYEREFDLANELVKLFLEYREYFGVSEFDKSYPDENPLERQCDFENKFAEVFCNSRGHELVPDQCGKPEHDFCVMCNQTRESLEK